MRRPIAGVLFRELQALFSEAERRGYEVPAVKGTHGERGNVEIVVAGHGYAVIVSELTDSVPMTEAELKEWQRQNSLRYAWEKEREPPTHQPVASGRLKLSLPSRWTAHAAIGRKDGAARSRASSSQSSRSSSVAPPMTIAAPTRRAAAKRSGDGRKRSAGSEVGCCAQVAPLRRRLRLRGRLRRLGTRVQPQARRRCPAAATA